MINSCGFLYNVVTKFQLILLLSDEFNERMDEITISISSPNSCSNLFSSLTYKVDNFKLFLTREHLARRLLHQCPREKILNWPVAIFSLLRLFSWSPSNKKLITSKVCASKQISGKKLVCVVQIFENSEIVN